MNNSLFATDNNIFHAEPVWDNPDLWGGGKGTELNGVLGVTGPNELLLGPYASDMDNLIVYDNGKIRTRRAGTTGTEPSTSSSSSTEPSSTTVATTTPSSSTTNGNTGNYTIWIIISVVIIFLIIFLFCIKYVFRNHVNVSNKGGKTNVTFDNKVSTFESENVISHADDL